MSGRGQGRKEMVVRAYGGDPALTGRVKVDNSVKQAALAHRVLRRRCVEGAATGRAASGVRDGRNGSQALTVGAVHWVSGGEMGVGASAEAHGTAEDGDGVSRRETWKFRAGRGWTLKEESVVEVDECKGKGWGGIEWAGALKEVSGSMG